MESNDLDAASTDMDKDGQQPFVVPDFARRDILPSLSLQLTPSSHSPPFTTGSLPPDSAADTSFGRSSTQSPDGSYLSGSSILTPAPPFPEAGATATGLETSPRSPEGSDLSPTTTTPSAPLFGTSTRPGAPPSAFNARNTGEADSAVPRQPSWGPQRTRASLSAASATSPRSGSRSPPESSPGASKDSNKDKSKDKDKEKRKRSRVTPEQLTSLEHFFAMDRSPTAARRKEISELLGMVERQTQIWFQNRRAKAKLQDGKRSRPDSIFGAGGIGSMGIGIGGGDWADLLPSVDAPPPQLSPDHEAELRRLIHEEGPVNFIPCTDLTIGTWRRIASSSSIVSSSGVYSGVGSQLGMGPSNTRHDLIAYTANSGVIPGQRCLTWFIHSAGLGFKMQIPLDTIIGTDFRLVGGSVGIGEQGLVTFVLSRPPEFYLEDTVLVAPVSGNPMQPHASPVQRRVWKKCIDWTEGMQATKVLRHDLIGSALHIAYFLQELRDSRSFGGEGTGIKLVTPHQQQTTSFGTTPGAPSLSPPAVQLPQLPQLPQTPAGFGTQPPPQSQAGGAVGGVYSSSGITAPSRRPEYMTHGRKRSYSTPPTLSTVDIAAQQGLGSATGGYPVQHPLSATFPSMQNSPLSSSPSPYPPPSSAGSSTPMTGTRISQLGGNLHSPMYSSYSGAQSTSPPLSGPTPPTMHHPQHRYQSPTQPIYQQPGNAADPHSSSPRDRALDVNPLMGSTVLNPSLLPQPAGMASTGPGPTSTAQMQSSYDSLRWTFPEGIPHSSQHPSSQSYMHALNNQQLTTLTSSSSSQHLYNPTLQQPTSESGHSASSLNNPSSQHFHAEHHRQPGLHNTSRAIYPIDTASSGAPVVSGMPGLPSTPFDNIQHPLQQQHSAQQQSEIGQEGTSNTTVPPSFERQ